MKKVLILVALLSLPACAQLQQLGTFATVGIANPITSQMLYDAENGMILAFAGLGAYKRSCIAGAIQASCRSTIQSIQGYTRQVPSLLTSARAFVKNNDQVNAQIAYNTILDLVNKAKAIATANGVQVGAN